MRVAPDLPRYGDVLAFTCLFYPLVTVAISLIAAGMKGSAGIIAGAFVFSFFVYLPFASLAFACIRKKMKRARACLVSTFLDLMLVYLLLGGVAYGLEGVGIGFLGIVVGFFILYLPWLLCCCLYWILLQQRLKRKCENPGELS